MDAIRHKDVGQCFAHRVITMHGRCTANLANTQAVFTAIEAAAISTSTEPASKNIRTKKFLPGGSRTSIGSPGQQGVLR